MTISVANSNIKIKNIRTKLNEVIGRVNTLPNTSLTVSKILANGSYANVVTNISAIRFDDASGFDVVDLGGGNAKIQMNSTFKYWNVNGVSGLTAEGLDTVNFIAGPGIQLTANATAKSFKITANSFSTTIRTRNIIPETNGAYSLGTPTKRFKSLYVSSNTVYIGPVALGVSTNGVFQVTQANNVTQTIVTESKVNGKTKITELVLQTVLGTKYGGTGLSALTPNGVMFGANSSVIGFITGSSGTVMQISPNGTPAFDDLDGGSF